MGWFGNTPIFWKHPYTSHLPKRNSTMEVPHLSKHIGTTCDLQDWFFSNRTSLVGGWITHLKHMRTSNWIISPGRGEQITRFETTTTTTLLKYTSPPPRNCSRWTGKNTTKKNNTVFLFTWNGKKHTHTPQKKDRVVAFFLRVRYVSSFLLFIYVQGFWRVCIIFWRQHHSQSLRTPARRFRDSSWKKSPAAEVGPQERLHKKKHHLQFLVETPPVYIDLY